MRLSLRLLLPFTLFLVPGWSQTLNLSQDLVRLGIASTNMTPNQPTQDAGPLLSKGVQYAATKKIGTVIADPGAYYFLSPQVANYCFVCLGPVTNMTIDFQGSSLILMNNPQTSGIILSNSTNAVLQNFTVDFQPLPFTQVNVVSANAVTRAIQFTTQPGYLDPAILNSSISGPFDVFIFRNGHVAPSTTRMSAVLPISGNTARMQGDFLPATSPLGQIRAGDVAVITGVALGSPISLASCSACTFRNVTAYSGQPVSAYYSPATLFERLYAIPKPATDRLVSTFGAGVIVSGGANNTIRLSRAIRTMDDGFGIVVWVTGQVQARTAIRTLTVAGIGATTLGQGQSLANGSPVTFERPSDGTILGSATVVSQVAPATFSSPYQVVYTFDRDLPDTLAGSLMYPTDSVQRLSNSAIDQSTVQEQVYARGMITWGLADSAVRRSYIRHSALAGVFGSHRLINPDWLVPPLVNFTLANNVIDGTNMVLDNDSLESLAALEVSAQQSSGSPMQTSPHQNISMTGNFIADSGRSAVWVGNTTGGSVTGNYFLNANARAGLDFAYPPYKNQALQPLVTDLSANITTAGNTVDSTSGRVWVTDTQYRELAAYAPGSTVRLNAYNIGKLASPSLTLTGSDGTALPVTIQATTASALDVLIPSAAPAGGAAISFTSAGVKSFATLFLDGADNVPAVNGCTFQMSPSSVAAPSDSTALPILVVTQPGCAYQMLATDSFVSATTASAGTGVINVTLAANTGAARSATIEIAGQPIVLSQAGASLPVITDVVNGATFLPQITSGSWATVRGTNLATTTRPWATSDFIGTALPTKLDNTSVTINGKPAYVYYITSGQLNVLVPDDATTGPVNVQVTTPAGKSNVVSANKAALSPGLFLFTSIYPATIHLDGSYVGPQGLIPGVGTTPAHSGETLILFGTGFGATTPVIPSAFTFTTAAQIGQSVTATVGGKPASVVGYLISPGLYQFNLTLPTLPNGDAALSLAIAGQSTPSGLNLAIQN